MFGSTYPTKFAHPCEKSVIDGIRAINFTRMPHYSDKYVKEEKARNLFLFSDSFGVGLVYGSVTLVRYPNHSIRAKSDKYNFEMHNWLNPLNWGRNFETIIGG